jgi:hypothetical protein
MVETKLLALEDAAVLVRRSIRSLESQDQRAMDREDLTET